MNADIIEIKENDMVMIHHCIGNMSNVEVDKYCKKLMPLLKSTFGKVLLIPIRIGKEWEFTIIKRPIEKTLKKVAKKK